MASPVFDLNYDFAKVVRQSEKVAWCVDDLIQEGDTLDFSKHLLPDPLSVRGRIDFLSEREELLLNQISGKGYLNMFALVEEYIIATALKHCSAEIFGDHDAIRALARFADEEVKHQQLFQRYMQAFDRGFGTDVAVLDEPVEVAGTILSKSPIAVLLVTIHIEWNTQAHFTDCVRDDRQIDQLIVKLLRHHWMEEAQHVKIDLLELDKLADGADEETITTAFDEYEDVVVALDAVLVRQAQMDVASLSLAAGRTFADDERIAIQDAQHAILRNMWLANGMRHLGFRKIVEQLSSGELARLDRLIRRFSGASSGVE